MSFHLIELNSFSPQQNIIIGGIYCRLNAYYIIYNNIMLVHNTCRYIHCTGYVEIEKVKYNIDVVL